MQHKRLRDYEIRLDLTQWGVHELLNILEDLYDHDEAVQMSQEKTCTVHPIQAYNILFSLYYHDSKLDDFNYEDVTLQHFIDSELIE